MKDLTLKDVLYALEFGGERLVGETQRIGGGMVWRMSSGRAVWADIARKAADNPGVEKLVESFDSVVYGWRKAAA